MSCSYDFQCLDCKASAGLDWNHAGQEMADALMQRRGFEALNVLADGLSWRFTDLSEPLLRIARFFSAHSSGHNVVVIDEYGKIWSACGKDVEFGCGHRHYCRLPPGHAGRCSHTESN